MGRGHRLAEVRRARGSGSVVAVCACGLVSPAFSGAGLAGSYVDAHVDWEESRAAYVDSVLLHLEAMVLHSHEPASKERLQQVIDGVSERMAGGPSSALPSAFGTTTVLIDDDDEMVTDLRRSLAAAGTYEVVAVGRSGVDAVILTVVERPRLLIVDDVMPGMGGVNAISLLRRLESTARICLYAVSDHHSSSADLVVSKQVPPQGLAGRLADLGL